MDRKSLNQRIGKRATVYEDIPVKELSPEEQAEVNRKWEELREFVKKQSWYKQQ